MEHTQFCPICGGTGTEKNGREVGCACCHAILFIIPKDEEDNGTYSDHLEEIKK